MSSGIGGPSYSAWETVRSTGSRERPPENPAEERLLELRPPAPEPAPDPGRDGRPEPGCRLGGWSSRRSRATTTSFEPRLTIDDNPRLSTIPTIPSLVRVQPRG